MNVYSTPEQIAEYYLSKESMSNKKLNKILYYAYCWTLTLLNDRENGVTNKLFDEPFQAWVHGPVCYSIYQKYREYGWNDIPKSKGKDIELSSAVKDVLDDVWKVYGHYSADELESMTHQEEPWKAARKGLDPFAPSDRPLRDDVIFEFYTIMQCAKL